VSVVGPNEWPFALEDWDPLAYAMSAWVLRSSACTSIASITHTRRAGLVRLLQSIAGIVETTPLNSAVSPKNPICVNVATVGMRRLLSSLDISPRKQRTEACDPGTAAG